VSGLTARVHDLVMHPAASAFRHHTIDIDDDLG
jgi:hypothetical protein